MDKNEFLAFVAFGNTCSLDSDDPEDYGFTSWTSAYRCIKHWAGTIYHEVGAMLPFVLIDSMSDSFTLGDALVKAYGDAAFVLEKAEFYEVCYED